MKKLIIKSLFVIIVMTSPLSVLSQERLVVIGGALTEIVFALGAGEKVVAVDTTSLYPDQVSKLPNVGYMRALAVEGVLSVKPTMVIASESAGPPEQINHLKRTGVDIHLVSDQHSLESIIEKIDVISALLNKEAEAGVLKQSFHNRMIPVLETIKLHAGQKPRILVFLGMQGGQLMAAGKQTQADAVVNILGGVNAAGHFNGYKPMNKEAVIAAHADAIIMLTHGPEKQDDIATAFAYTQAASNNKIIVAPSTTLLGFGIRFPEALSDVVHTLYAK